MSQGIVFDLQHISVNNLIEINMDGSARGWRNLVLLHVTPIDFAVRGTTE